MRCMDQPTSTLAVISAVMPAYEPHADRKIARVADVGHINAALFHLHAILLEQLVAISCAVTEP